MKQAAKWLTTTGVLIVLGVIACSSSSGGGGGGGGSCLDVSGTWSLSGDCQSPSSCTVTQNGCSATLACGTETTTATVSGSSLSFQFGSAPCTGSVSNGVFSGTCSESGSSCNVSASCSGGVCGSQNASGGSGGTSPGSGGTSPGSGGTSPGSGGTGPGNCGGTLYSNDGACQSCMETSCCNELAACAVGTPCDALFNCIVTNNCTDEACLTQFCSEQIQSGGPAFTALFDCDEANCLSQCGGGG